MLASLHHLILCQPAKPGRVGVWRSRRPIRARIGFVACYKPVNTRIGCTSLKAPYAHQAELLPHSVSSKRHPSKDTSPLEATSPLRSPSQREKAQPLSGRDLLEEPSSSFKQLLPACKLYCLPSNLSTTLANSPIQSNTRRSTPQ